MDKLHHASHSASHLARYLAMAAALDLRNIPPTTWLKMSIEALTETANALGYVLVRTDAEGASEKPASDETEAA